MKLFIVADDITGALDTAVQFAQMGIDTMVLPAPLPEGASCPEDADVVVVNAKTRHLPPKQAYQTVLALTRQALQKSPSPYLYKKTDSTMRGNIGSELAAMLMASEAPVMAFVPAFPGQDRITVEGVQYANGKPVAEGGAGMDLFEPPTLSYIPDIIHAQSDVAVEVIPSDGYGRANFSWTGVQRILVYDAQSDADMRAIAGSLGLLGAPRALAGCAAFASVLPGLLGLRGEQPAVEIARQKMVVVCGSVNPVAHLQLQYGEANGYVRKTLTARQILQSPFPASEIGDRAAALLSQNEVLIIDANDQTPNEKMDYAARQGIGKDAMREMIAVRLGEAARAVLQKLPDAIAVFIGGDTLSGFLDCMEHVRLCPVREVMPGTVLSLLKTEDGDRPLLSRAGGFGDEAWLVQMQRMLWGRAVCCEKR